MGDFQNVLAPGPSGWVAASSEALRPARPMRPLWGGLRPESDSPKDAEEQSFTRVSENTSLSTRQMLFFFEPLSSTRPSSGFVQCTPSSLSA